MFRLTVVLAMISVGLPAPTMAQEESTTSDEPGAVSQQPGEQSAKQAFFAGLDLKEAGDLEGAVARFQIALSNEPSLHQARLHLAECYHLLGMDAEARAELTTYLGTDFPGAEVKKAQELMIACGGELDSVAPQGAGESSVSNAQAASKPAGGGSRAGPAVFVAGLHFGPSFSAFSPLKTFVLPRLEVGVALPFAGQRIQVLGTLAYMAPPSEGAVDDSRVSGASFSYALVHKELMLGFGVNVRFLELGRRINPYVGIAPQIYLMETVIDGDADGAAFGESRERYSKMGIYVGAGAELRLGPGALFVQLGFTYSKLDGQISGDSNTGALSPSVGYRLLLGPLASSKAP